MPGTNLVRGDSWTIALPDGWKAPEPISNGTVYIDSFDESKGIYLTTWLLPPEDASSAPADAAESFKDKDLEALHSMEGYTWQLVEEHVDEPDAGVVMVTMDHLAGANEYRIVTKIIARPPVVVRAAFHDYSCDDYAASRKYFAPLVQSLSLVTSDTPPAGSTT